MGKMWIRSTTQVNTMNQIVVKRNAHEMGIQNPVACLIEGLDVTTDRVLNKEVTELESKIKDHGDEIVGKPEIKAFHEFYRKLGYPDQLPAGEQMIKLIQSEGLNRHNNVVDAYNLASAESGIGLSMHDTAQIDGDIVVRRATGGERILPIFESEVVTANAGDVVYGAGDLLRLLGPIARDSDEFKVTESTESALLMALGNHETSHAQNRAVCERAFELISETNPDATIEYLEVVHEKRAVAP